MTQRCDVVIVGGGLLGTALAWLLSRNGVDVILFERDQINQHASGQNAGSLHFQLEYRMVEQGIEAAKRSAEAMPLHLDAARAWAGLTAELGEDLGVVQAGGLMLAEDVTQARVLEEKTEIERSWGLDVELLSGAEVRARAPYLSDRVVAATYCPAEGKANTRTAAPAFARAAARQGAQMHATTEVVALQHRGLGWHVVAKTAPVDAREIRVDCDAVVLTAGVWTTAMGRLLNVDLPTLPVALTMTATARTAPFLGHLVQHAGTKLSMKQTSEGNVLVGGGWPARLGTDWLGEPDLRARPELIAESLAGNAAAAIGVVPTVADLPVLRTWTGITTLTPDQLPLLGSVPGRAGVFVATGGSAFTLGPTYARMLAALVMGQTPDLDIAAYDPRRFAEASVA